jgi:hypothetical protein
LNKFAEGDGEERGWGRKELENLPKSQTHWKGFIPFFCLELWQCRLLILALIFVAVCVCVCVCVCTCVCVCDPMCISNISLAWHYFQSLENRHVFEVEEKWIVFMTVF